MNIQSNYGDYYIFNAKFTHNLSNYNGRQRSIKYGCLEEASVNRNLSLEFVTVISNILF